MFYPVYALFYLFSLLPIQILYLIGDAIYLLLYYVIGYRKTVVMNNLAIAFADKSEMERKLIMKKFYHNFVDTFIETIKLISASRSWIKKRFKADPTVFHELHKKGKRCQIHLGHNFNWEIANDGLPLYVDYPFIVVYMPISNKIFDRLFMKLRSRTGTIMLPATDMKNALMPYREKLYILTLVADQVPGDVDNAYWLNFFGKPTPFLRGPERGARIGNIPVVFAHITKWKRGHYEVHFRLEEEEPRKLSEGELTRRYIKFLEQVIRESPDMWLWSHRRWKKDWKPGYKKLWMDVQPSPDQS